MDMQTRMEALYDENRRLKELFFNINTLILNFQLQQNAEVKQSFEPTQAPKLNEAELEEFVVKMLEKHSKCKCTTKEKEIEEPVTVVSGLENIHENVEKLSNRVKITDPSWAVQGTTNGNEAPSVSSVGGTLFPHFAQLENTLDNNIYENNTSVLSTLDPLYKVTTRPAKVNLEPVEE